MSLVCSGTICNDEDRAEFVLRVDWISTDPGRGIAHEHLFSRQTRLLSSFCRRAALGIPIVLGGEAILSLRNPSFGRLCGICRVVHAADLLAWFHCIVAVRITWGRSRVHRPQFLHRSDSSICSLNILRDCRARRSLVCVGMMRIPIKKHRNGWAH